MKRLSVALAAVAIMALGATSEITCNIPDLVVVTPPLRVVTVHYINDADGDVAVSLLAHGDDDMDEDDLEEDGREYNTLVPLGGEETLVFDCDRAGSIMIDRAKLFVVGDLGPSMGTDAFHIGEDYECGDTINFGFYNNPLLTDLYVDVFLN
jgi:hypothetical protein